MSEQQTQADAAVPIPASSPGAIAMTEQLQVAIDHAYAVFAPYASRFTAHVCMCNSCFTEADRDRLLKLPLRLIDGGLLDQYSWSAHGEDDDGLRSDDLRYLLPRYFELFALNDPKLHNSPECNLMQLGRTPYRLVWPAAEVVAIDRYFDVLLTACLANGTVDGGWKEMTGSRYRCALRTEEVIAMLIRAGADVGRLLETWYAAPDPGAALHMAHFRFALVNYGDEARLANPHLETDHVEQARAFGAFVTNADATRRIEKAFFQTTDPAAQQLLSDALHIA
ncbi:MAG: hypothetical protein ACRCU5_11945 [Rhizobiaceae bacterium]